MTVSDCGHDRGERLCLRFSGGGEEGFEGERWKVGRSLGIYGFRCTPNVGELTGRPVRAHVVLEGVEVRNAFQGSYEPLVIRAEFEEENGARKSSSDSKLRPRPGERPRPWKQGAPGGELRKAKSGSKINYF